MALTVVLWAPSEIRAGAIACDEALLTPSSGEAFSLAILTHLPVVRRIARSYRLQPADVDDVVQHVFLTALVRRHSFEPGSNLESWLATLARNHIHDLFRSRGHARFQEPLDEIAVARANLRQRPNQEHALELEELAPLVARYLTPEQQQILHLLTQGLTPEEIAEETGVNRNTIRTRLLRARRRLEKLLALPRLEVRLTEWAQRLRAGRAFNDQPELMALSKVLRAGLDLRQFEVLELRYVRRLSDAEMARALKVSLEALGERLDLAHRALLDGYPDPLEKQD